MHAVFNKTGNLKHLFNNNGIFVMPFLIKPVFYLLIFARGGAAWGGLAEKGCHRTWVDVHCCCPWAPKVRFLWIRWEPKTVSKKQRFFESSKIDLNSRINRPWGSNVGFWSKTSTFGLPFGIIFFYFFGKRRKCVISEEYNAKRCFEPSESFDFRIDFLLNFRVFS